MPTDTLSLVVGDPLEVLAAGRTMSSIAAAIADTASRLRALAQATNTSDGVAWTGQAAVKAYACTISLPPKLDKAQASYAEAGGALTDYATKLAQAQADSAAAIRAATIAQADLAQATAAKAVATNTDAQQSAAAAAAGQPPPARTAPRYDATIESARVQLDRARAANSAAHEQQTAAACRAAAALKHASRDGIANKHWWQKAVSNVTHWADLAWTNSLQFISTYAAQISAITGMIALVLSVAGLIFPPLELAAGVFETASATFGAFAAISDLALALSGKGSWANLGWDALALLPAGAGRITRKLTPKLRSGKVLRVARRSTNVEDDVAMSAVKPQRVRTSGHDDRALITLSTDESWRSPSTLPDHFARHGPDFGSLSEDMYAAEALHFLQDGLQRGLPTKVDSAGTIRIYDRSTNSFGSYAPDGTTRTYYKPDPRRHRMQDNWVYWLTQPGKEPWGRDT